ncbi:hypothetical protein [Nitrospirillum viridazoti]|uniref:Uncharacterized protein n=1 Tax=Nitrospirillum amazonense TaxID=28077 RepID=A0A560IIM0_9PROT|nr:hypothetical protein [Nitrospirillum amazonense]TWB56630.1 hypothetical protein FBZ92_11050 [Nitrospirillum amazonense]
MPNNTTADKLEISVYIDPTPNTDTGEYTWYYNNMSAPGFTIRVPKNVSQILFSLDTATAGAFVFDAPDITSVGGCKDLILFQPTGLRDQVVIFDTQENINQIVGGITLKAYPKGSDGNALLALQPLRSDPEILNTGGESDPGPNR